MKRKAGNRKAGGSARSPRIISRASFEQDGQTIDFTIDSEGQIQFYEDGKEVTEPDRLSSLMEHFQMLNQLKP